MTTHHENVNIRLEINACCKIYASGGPSIGRTKISPCAHGWQHDYGDHTLSRHKTPVETDVFTHHTVLVEARSDNECREIATSVFTFDPTSEDEIAV